MLRWWLGIVLSLALLLPISVHAQQEFAKTVDLPDWRLVLWDTVVRPELYYFGWCSAPLGDINGDGYDDLAVSSRADTTFIFLGGDPFNHQHAYIVRGGSAGIASADFNRDGKMDLVTAIENDYGYGEYYPEQRGAIRLYLQKQGDIPFTWEPDLLIEGDIGELLGQNTNQFRGAIFTPDFNGDGWPDILARTTDERDSVEYKGVLFLGGPNMDAHPDAEFRVGIPQYLQHPYMWDLLVGDINGDGYDDVMIHSQFGMSDPVYYWDLYLGNPWAYVGAPNRVLQGDIGWAPAERIANIMDVDADGYDDILDAGPESLHKWLGDALFFRGKPLLPQILLPDDSIPNRNPRDMADLSPQIICPVGDMNGDGINDLVMGWNTYFGAGASVYYFYPGGQQFRTALGFFGTVPERDRVGMGVYPAGDLNGDGFDDLITLGRGSRSGLGNLFQIWLGASQLRTAVENESTPGPYELQLAPNPLPSGQCSLNITMRGVQPGAIDLTITDIIGHTARQIHLDNDSGQLQHTLDLSGFPAGMYLLSLRQGAHTVQQKLLVY
jgi:hypothetical protein